MKNPSPAETSSKKIRKILNIVSTFIVYFVAKFGLDLPMVFDHNMCYYNKNVGEKKKKKKNP